MSRTSGDRTKQSSAAGQVRLAHGITHFFAAVAGIEDVEVLVQALVGGIGNFLEAQAVVIALRVNGHVSVHSWHPDQKPIRVETSLSPQSAAETKLTEAGCRWTNSVPLIYQDRSIAHLCVGRRQPRISRLQEFALDTIQSLSAMLLSNARTALSLRERTRQLQDAYEDLKTSYWHLKKIQEVLPICMSCGKIKTADAKWEDVVDYLRSHSLFLSHGYCPECLPKARNRATSSGPIY